MTTLPAPPVATLRREDDLPFIDLPAFGGLQLLQVDLAQGLWVVRTRFTPGTTIATHRHTGPVYAFTQSGSWYYLEYPDSVNVAGSYLYEPAGSVHTLHVPADNDEVTDVSFVIHGANLNLDEAGDIVSITDAHGILQAYRALCATQHGMTDPPVIVQGEAR